mmetsp:Transcript_25596/g.55756  ORF Transcript_25596/g.55756 Transcript_25596/m.55756 type:complete len:87 (-) Transcript_25596:183-443(-)
MFCCYMEETVLGTLNSGHGIAWCGLGRGWRTAVHTMMNEDKLPYDTCMLLGTIHTDRSPNNKPLQQEMPYRTELEIWDPENLYTNT